MQPASYLQTVVDRDIMTRVYTIYKGRRGGAHGPPRAAVTGGGDGQVRAGAGRGAAAGLLRPYGA